MATSSPARLRAFVRRNTHLADVHDLPGVRLHLADDVMKLLELTGRELGQSDPDLPYWAFAWAGGLGIVRYLAEHPEEVTGRRVLDLASGSGLCAFAALRAGAASVLAADIDPFSEAAIALNAQANGVTIAFSKRDLLADAPPSFGVILAGDVLYAETMSGRMLEWLGTAAGNGARVLIGDPGRRYLPGDLELLATYRVQASHEIEHTEARESSVFTIAGRTARPD